MILDGQGAPLSAREVEQLHQNDDVDVRRESHHHTLGRRATQASPGNHVHDGYDSERIPAENIDWASGVDPASGFLFSETVKYTANGTFKKADYPGIRAVRVRMVGGGGAGGGAAAAGSGAHAAGGGGASGSYAEKVITASALLDTETVTVGAGGTGVSGADGGAGATSSFGAHVSATGGEGGKSGSSSKLMVGARGGYGQSGSVGDFVMNGNPGTQGFGNATLAYGGMGGSSVFGPGGLGSYTGSGGGTHAEAPTSGYGGGGSGRGNNQSAAAGAGGSGASGIVFVDVYK